MAGPRSGAVRRFTISPERISGDRVVFDAAESRHLVRVLRLHPGDLVIAADGHGHAYRVRILTLGATATGAIVGGAAAAEESALTISLVQGIPKGDQMEVCGSACGRGKGRHCAASSSASRPGRAVCP